MDEKQLKELEVQLANLGKSIDSKLDEFSKKAKEASVEELKKLKDEMKKELEAPIKEYNEKSAKLQGQVDELETKLQRVNVSTEKNKTFVEAIKEEMTKFATVKTTLKDMIQQMIDYFVGLEEYEKCSFLKKVVKE
jgi:chromosome segregation ATPase